MEVKKNQMEYFQVRAHVTTRISNFRGIANVEESTTVDQVMGQTQGSQFGDLFQAGHHHANLGMSGDVRNDMLEGQSDQGVRHIREQVIAGDRKNNDSDLNSLHLPETSVTSVTSVASVASTISGSHIISVRPATSS